jgi:hypothetical protein
MTDTEYVFDSHVVLWTLRTLRHPHPDLPPPILDPVLLRKLESQGLAFRRNGEWTTSSAADRLLDAIEEVGVQMLADFESCEYTHAHTSTWCGNPYCRSS